VLDRRSDRENRLRFVGFGTDAFSQGTPKDVDLLDACGLDVFEADGDTFIAGAGGCDDLYSSLLSRFPPELCDAKTLDESSGCNYECCQAAFQNEVAHWDFSVPFTVGPQFINPILDVRGQKVVCSSGVCSYSRNKNVDEGCFETYATNVGPATFRDRF